MYIDESIPIPASTPDYLLEDFKKLKETGKGSRLPSRQRIWMERSARQMLCSCSPGMVSRNASDSDERNRMSMMDI